MNADDEGHYEPQINGNGQGDAADTEGSASENNKETESDMLKLTRIVGQLLSQKSQRARSSIAVL